MMEDGLGVRIEVRVSVQCQQRRVSCVEEKKVFRGKVMGQAVTMNNVA